MNPPCFLLDENMPHRTIRKLLQQRASEMRVWVVGQQGAPPLSAPDPELLVWIEEHHCLLVTRNRASMPGHLRDHLATGRHIPGILIMPRRLTAWQVADELHLVWGASQAGEFQDQIIYLPVA